jgi:hypothetical protein
MVVAEMLDRAVQEVRRVMEEINTEQTERAREHQYE